MPKNSLILAALLAVSASPFAAPISPEAPLPAPDMAETARLVVKLKATSNQNKPTQDASDFLAKVTGRPVQVVKAAPGARTVIQLASAVSISRAQALSAALVAAGKAEVAEPDYRVAPSALNDVYFRNQWPLSSSANSLGGAGFDPAWTRSGQTKTVVAVIDTGSVNHADMAANEVAGYDFITDPVISGDSDGRDANPADAGDFCTATGRNSSWHGLKVASLIAAVGGNAMGIAGAAYKDAIVLHARALGRCGGYLSDVADAVAWSAGVDVSGVPRNTNPAKILNLSLGTSYTVACPSYMQESVTAARNAGAVLVSATGNEGAAGVGAPASCEGVIAVAAHNNSADLATYSNRSSRVTLTAPGGGSCSASLLACDSTPTVSLGNTGATAISANVDGVYFQGTSAATPHVSAAIAVMMGANPGMTANQAAEILLANTRPFPSGTFCSLNAGQCGVGMLDVERAVAAVPVFSVSASASQSIARGGSSVALNASATARATYSWSQVSGESVVLSGRLTSSPVFSAPANKGAPLVFEVTATSDVGVKSTAQVAVTVNNALTWSQPLTYNVVEGAAFELSLPTTDADGEALRYELVSTSGAIIANNKLIWANPQRSNKSSTSETFEIILVSNDSTGDISGQASVVLNVIVTAPNSGSGSGTPGTGGSTPDSGGGFGLLWSALLAVAAETARRSRVRR